jgi:ABC-2 type transport system ATP-binding protein
MNAAIIHADSIAVSFGKRVALDGVDLLQQGGIVTVLGPNGAGKSTLLRCLATVLEPDRGALSIDGLDPRREHERTEIRRRLGYLPQHAVWNDQSTAYDALDYFAVLRELRDDRQRRRRVFEVLDRVGLRDRAGTRIGELSGGMRSRLGIAQALLGSPSLLVLDEPAAGLDPEERLRLRAVLAERRASTTTIVSTHLTDEAAVSDVVIVLDAGRVAFTGVPAALAGLATGNVWLQRGLPAPDVLASWRLVDGTYRCLGAPPAGATPVPPSIEEGYLIVRSRSSASV